MKFKLFVLPLLVVGLVFGLSSSALATVTVSFDDVNSIADADVEETATGIPAVVLIYASDSTAVVTIDKLALESGLTYDAAGDFKYTIWEDVDANGVVSWGDIVLKAIADMPAIAGVFLADVTDFTIPAGGSTSIIITVDATLATVAGADDIIIGADVPANNVSAPTGVWFANDDTAGKEPDIATANMAAITAVADPVETLTQAAAATTVAAATDVPNLGSNVTIVNAKLTAGAGASQTLTSINLVEGAAYSSTGAPTGATSIDSVRVYIDLGTVGTLDAADIRVPLVNHLMETTPDDFVLTSGIFVPASGNVTIIITADLTGDLTTDDVAALDLDASAHLAGSADAGAGVDAAGAGATVDAIDITRETVDVTGPPYGRPNGYLDAIKVSFSVAGSPVDVDDDLIDVVNDWNVLDGGDGDNHTESFSATYNSDVADNNYFYIKIEELAASITEDLNKVAYTQDVAALIVDTATGTYALPTVASTAATDKAPPAPLYVKTVDTTGDGKIDIINVQFSEALSANSKAGFTFGDYVLASATRKAGVSADGTFNTLASSLLEITLTVVAADPYDTGATPAYTYSDVTGVLAGDVGANKVLSFNNLAVPVKDGAAPTLVKVTSLDDDYDGMFDQLQLDFSEAVQLNPDVADKTADDLTDNTGTDGLNFGAAHDGAYDFTSTGNTGLGTSTLILPVNEVGSLDTAVEPSLMFIRAGGAGTELLADLAATPNVLAVSGGAGAEFTMVATAAGVVGADEALLVDDISPQILSAVTLDGSAQGAQNGKLDAIQLTFSEAMGTDITTYEDLVIAGIAIEEDSTVVTGVNVLVGLVEDAYNTGVEPSITYSGDTIEDASGAALGTISETAVDNAVPLIVVAATADKGYGDITGEDLVNNGIIDGLELMFSEPMNIAKLDNADDPGGTVNDVLEKEFTFTGIVYAVNDTVEIVDSQNMVVYITESGAVDSDALPDLLYTALGDSNLIDMNDYALASIATADVVETDGAPPVVIAASTVDDDNDGFLDGIELQFSETVTADSAKVEEALALEEVVNAIDFAGIDIDGATDTWTFVGASNGGEGDWDTDALPYIMIGADSGIEDAADNVIVAIDSVLVTVVDGAAPVIAKAIGQKEGTSIMVTFSEAVLDGGAAILAATDIEFINLAGDSTGTITISSVSTSSDSINFILTTSATLSSDNVDNDNIAIVAGNVKDIAIVPVAGYVDSVGIADPDTPTLVSATTMDVDMDGYIDNIKLVFSEDLKDENISGYAGTAELAVTADANWVLDSGYGDIGLNFTQDDDDADAATLTARQTGIIPPFGYGNSISNVSDVANDEILYLAIKKGSGEQSETGDTSARPRVTMLGGSQYRSGVSDFSNNWVEDITEVQADDGAGLVIMSAEMVSTTVMEVQLSEEINDNDEYDPNDDDFDYPKAAAVFEWLVGNQELPNESNIAHFTEPSSGFVILEVLPGAGLEPGTTSTLAFKTVDVIEDDQQAATNTAGPDETVDVTPPTGDIVEVAGEEDAEDVPEVYNLSKNFPNPFNPTTTINYDVPVDGKNVEIVIYNMSGQKVRTLVSEAKSAGFYQVIWDGTNNMGETVASGVYLYRMVSGNFSKIDKMMFIK